MLFENILVYRLPKGLTAQFKASLFVLLDFDTTRVIGTARLRLRPYHSFQTDPFPTEIYADIEIADGQLVRGLYPAIMYESVTQSGSNLAEHTKMIKIYALGLIKVPNDDLSIKPL